jgi:very-short-patch-repair endonuclease
MLLAAHISASPDLEPLFAFNVPVVTLDGTRHMADLLWREGRLIIEIDGYTHHSSRNAFAGDRELDFRLMLSGYRVVRIPHGEAFWSADAALEKIRKAVEFVRGRGA